jgi:WD40 repeat protein
LLSAGYDEIRRIIREDEPPKPSTRLGTMGDAALTELAKCRQSDPQRLRSLIRGDLDWIVMKALEKDRTRRYETSGAMVLDIQRHLASEPISAGAPSTLYRLRKYVRRNRSAVAGLSVVIGLLMAGVLVLLAFNTQLDDFNRQLEARERSTRVNLYASDMFAVSESIAAGNFVLARKLLEDHLPGKGEEDLRGFEWWHYRHASRGEQAQTLGGHEGVITGIASSTEGGLMVTTDASGLVQLWKRSGDRFAPFASVRVDNLRTNRGTFRFPEPAFSPDGKRLFLMTQESREARGQLVTGPQSGVVAYEVTSRGVGEIVNTYPNVSAYAASPSRPELALLSGSELKVVNYESGEEKRFDAEGINNLSFVGLDGNRLAFIEPSGDSVGILALHGDEPRQSRKVLSWGLRVAGDPTGKHVAVCLRNNQVELVSLDPSLPNRIIMLGDTGSTDGFVMDTAFSGDGRYLAACGPDLTIKVFETASGDLVQVFRGHGYPVQRLAFVPGGEVIVSGAGEGAAFVWEVGSRNSTDLVDGLRASFSPDGGSFLVREVGTQASLLRATQSGAVLGRKVEDEICLGYAPDGKSILYARRHSPLVPVERTQLAAGALGYEVQQLQALLIAAEGPIMSIDGDFGQRTSGALRRFQERAGVPVTGTSDEATWDALYAFHHDSYFDLIVWRDLAGRETGRSVQLDACPPFGMQTPARECTGSGWVRKARSRIGSSFREMGAL